MRLPLRIAILMCDSPLYNTAEKYGNYGGVFAELLESSAELLRHEIPGLSAAFGLEITSWDINKAEEYPNLEDIDAILLTGSRANAFDDQPWIVKLIEFVKKILEQDRIRIIGVCFGHQILGRALGLPVDRNDIGWEISVTNMNLTPIGQKLFLGNRSPNVLTLQHMHRDIIKVDNLPNDIDNLAYTDTCKIQGMYKQGRFISVQGHPEFTAEIVKEILDARRKLGIFTEEEYNEAMGRVKSPHDGLAVGAAFLRFLTSREQLPN
ncbi:class I glutamine amidotransferase-like protein [Kalaharituber pfeilii]|nr:class I glutamine amidotransferase-like protein [Kalaharituber pfeilii]